MSLLSNSKVSIFNENLLGLMKVLVEENWCKPDQTSDYGSVLIDKMQFYLDPIKRPYEDLIVLFAKENKNPENLADYHEEAHQTNFMKQRRVMVTPTLIRYSVAQDEQTNRVIREYKNFIPNFIRLSFVTEDLDKGYYFSYQGCVNYLLGYIHGIITNGFSLGNLRFQFLGYSNSQLKSHSCWFLCNNNPQARISAGEVDKFMGNFDKEKNVLKKYARKGQCFSTSTFVQKLTQDQVQMNLPDVTRDGFTFTDGVGHISEALARLAAEKLGYKQCSAFQIRIAGAKGVLMVKPSLKSCHI